MKILCIVIGFLSIGVSAAVAQTTTSNSKVDFVIDPNRSYVYLLFDHVGEGTRYFDDEPSTRIWFRLVNNCRVPITVRTFGVSVSSRKTELGVMHNVVANPDVARFEGIPAPETSSIGSSEKSTSAAARNMPRGYDFELASLSVVLPNESLLFSIPKTHLSKAWHIEIPFEFEVPAGKCCRADAVGGEPRMFLSYSDWYLPEKVRRELRKDE